MISFGQQNFWIFDLAYDQSLHLLCLFHEGDPDNCLDSDKYMIFDFEVGLVVGFKSFQILSLTFMKI